MQVTSIEIRPAPRGEEAVKAIAHVIVNNALALRGIRIRKGRYGYFLSFPRQTLGSPYRVFETTSHKLRRNLETQIVREYELALSRSIVQSFL